MQLTGGAANPSAVMKEIYHSFMSAEEWPCSYAVDAGMIEHVPGKRERYRWVKK